MLQKKKARLPPPNLPKISSSSKKRSHSSVKLLPEPQFVSTGFGSKVSTRSDDRPNSKKGRVSKGKEVSEVFNPCPISYISSVNEKVNVMNTDSAFKNPNVARAMNEAMILEANADAVRKTTVFEMSEHHFQQVRLFAKTAAAAGAELEQ
ncbi:hypothetical protein FRX31_021942, partial [Thalictrum thalictroides]